MFTRFIALALVVAFSMTAAAQPPASSPSRDNVRAFAIGAPASLAALPPGRMLDRIRSLPPAAQRRALSWLQGFSFPVEDLESLRVDEDGGVLYRDGALPADATGSMQGEPSLAGSTVTPDDVFTLHSKPGSPNVVYLDFDGHLVTGTVWNGSGGALAARAYDLDGDPTSFSQSEVDAIAAIWHRVSEDFAAFDIDVTTEEPSQFTNTTGRVVITRDDDENGVAMPYAGAGGVAYINVWGRTGSYGYEYYSPAFVYYDNLGNGQARYVAEAVSHELGHNLALSHDGTSSVTYYSGHNGGPAGGYIDWAPIMGSSYGADVSQWSRGDYAGANNQQDDLAEIAARIGYAVDDHGDSAATASALVVDVAGNVTSTNPETDPFNLAPENKGVIESRTDVDYFVVSVGNGTLDLTVTPAWDAHYHDASRGANLDVHAALYDASGQLMAQSNPATETDARVVATLAAGNYLLAVSAVGAGDPVSAYDDYASAGMYFINGTVTNGPTNEPPNEPPNAADDTATAAEDGSVVLAVLGNDTDPEGQALSITSTTAASNGATSVNGSTITYTPAPDFAGTDSFAYSITDGFNTASATVTVTVTPVNDAPVAVDDTAVTDAATSVLVDVLANDGDVDGDGLSVSVTLAPVNGSATVSGDALLYSPVPGFVGVDTFGYTVSDGLGGTDTASVTVSVEDATPVPDIPADLAASDSGQGTAMVSWSASAGTQSYEVRRESKHKKRNAWNATTLVATTGAGVLDVTDPSGPGTFRYQVRAVGSSGASAWSLWAVVTVTDSSGGGGGGGKGRRK
jgi:hypothetical protein